MVDLLFTNFVKENRPLNRLLEEWGRPRVETVYGYRRVDFDGSTDEQLIDRAMRSWRTSQVTSLGRIGEPRLPARPQRSERRNPGGPDRPPMWRWNTVLRVDGNRDLLEAWPAMFDRDPCGDDLYHLPVPDWVCGLTDDGVYISVDVPCSEDPEGVMVPKERILAAAEYIDEYIRSAVEQATAYEKDLGQRMRVWLAAERKRLDTITEQMLELTELLRVPERSLELEDEEVPIDQAPVVASSDGQPVTLSRLLHERTFADLVSVTRKWGSAAERYPEAFGPLQEEILSSLLVPALNVAFDTASREVFSVHGKTDVFVEAVRSDRENAAYFGEAKVWHGPSQLTQDDVPQTLRYAGARATDAMLLYYVKQKNLGLSQRRTIEAMEAVEGFRYWVADGVALLTHPEWAHPIRITVVWVHIPAPGEEIPEPEN